VNAPLSEDVWLNTSISSSLVAELAPLKAEWARFPPRSPKLSAASLRACSALLQYLPSATRLALIQRELFGILWFKIGHEDFECLVIVFKRTLSNRMSIARWDTFKIFVSVPILSLSGVLGGVRVELGVVR
jgi:hypothetical protein